MSKYIIIYKGIPKPVQGKNKKQIIAQMQKDWECQQDLNAEFFVTFGINIKYQDFSTKSFELKTLNDWYEENRIKSK